jgi:N utilization substance protein B
MPKGLRHRARIAALQALFELEFAANQVDSILERTLLEKGLSEESAEFTCAIVNGVIGNRQFLDDVIGNFAPAFPVAQLAPMDRNILRLALFEILVQKLTPPKVAVNEAVELAKEFGAETSPKFVNGVLGSVIADILKQRNQ